MRWLWLVAMAEKNRDGTDRTRPAADTAAGFRRGVVWMILTAMAFTAMVVCVRYLEGEYHSAQVVFVRSLVGLVFIVPPLLNHGLPGLRTERLPMHMARAAFSLGAMAVYYFAVPLLPLADAITYTFAIPLFVVIGAVVVLKERVDAPRWLATIAGFVGVVILLRPGQGGFTLPVFMVLLSALFYAGAWITLKFLTRTETPSVIIFYQNVLIVILALIPTLFLGKWPDLHGALFLFAVGFFGTIAHFCQAKAFGAADASAIMPFDFLRLPFSVAYGWFLFGEITDIWTWTGAVVIFSSTWFITWYESRKRRQAAGTQRSGR